MKNKLTDLGITLKDVDKQDEKEIYSTYLPKMWVNQEKKIINENTFAKCYRDINLVRYNNGLFYSRDGKKTEDIVAKEIWESISDIGIATDVSQKVKKLLGAVKLASTVENLTTDENIIPFSNGVFHLDDLTFYSGEESSVPYKLPVSLQNNIKPTPNFDKWLSDLFEKEDILVMQEYLGYCLIPTTKAQKSLFLVGKGGMGKSGVGYILTRMLGDASLNIPNTQEFLKDKFKLPELEHKLVLYDDDLDNAAFSETGLYKKLITNTLPIVADRKYGQPFKFTPKIKIIACCNEMISSLYDHTEGFYRRLLPLKIKPATTNVVRDKDFYNKLGQEIEGITQWALIGLLRLINNDWSFSISQRTIDFLQQQEFTGNHFPDFISEVFEFDEDNQIASASILKAYELWCKKNAIEPKSSRTLQKWIADNSEELKIYQSNHICSNGNKQVRGYRGINIKECWTDKFVLSK